MTIQTASCIGTGVIGASWAISFARKMQRVWIYDASPDGLEQGLDLVRRALDILYDQGIISSQDEIFSKIKIANSLEEALSGSIFVQESIVEDREIKRSVFHQMDQLAGPDSILASSTSEIPPSEFMADLEGRHRCIITHPLNPPHLIPAVEVCPAEFTSPETVKKTMDFMTGAGQKPLLVNKEVKGFVMNRLQLAVIRESLHLVEQGICSVKDVDVAMKYGLGLRWATMGPFETNFLSTTGGYSYFLSPDGYYETMKNIADDLSTEFSFEPALGHKIDLALQDVIGDQNHNKIAAKRDHNLMQIQKYTT